MSAQERRLPLQLIKPDWQLVRRDRLLQTALKDGARRQSLEVVTLRPWAAV